MTGGVLSGLFAIGGGILMVPLLVRRARMDQRRAAATSLVAIMPNRRGQLRHLLAHGQIDVVAGACVALGAITGAVAGSRLLRRMPPAWLRWMFVVFILAVGVRLLFSAPERGQLVELSVTVALGHVGLGLVMGVASGLFGIGGGIIAVPLLVPAVYLALAIPSGTSGILFAALLLAVAAQLTVKALHAARARH